MMINVAINMHLIHVQISDTKSLVLFFIVIVFIFLDIVFCGFKCHAFINEIIL